MIVSITALSDKTESLDKLKKAVEKEGFEVLEINTAFKQLVKND